MEKDRLIHVFTKDRGLICAVARSARLPTSKLVGVLEPFTMADFEFVEGRNLYYITQATGASLLASEKSSRQTLDTLYELTAIILKIFHEEENNGGVYCLLVDAFVAVSYVEPNIVAAWFKWRMLHFIGFAPYWERESSESVLISIKEGGVIKTVAHDSFTISFKTYNFLRLLLEKDVYSFKKLKLPKTVFSEADRVISAFMWYYTTV